MLPHTDADTFEIYLQWLYTGEIVVVDQDDATMSHSAAFSDRAAFVNKRYRPLIKLAVLRDKIDDKALRNAVVDAAIQVKSSTKMVPGANDLTYACEALLTNSTLRRLLVDLWTQTTATATEPSRHHFSAGFLCDMVLSMQRRWAAGRPKDITFVEMCVSRAC